MVTARRNGKYITKNASHFKRVNPSLTTHQTHEFEDEDDLNFDASTNQPAQDSPHVPPTVDPPRRSIRVRNRPQQFEQSWTKT